MKVGVKKTHEELRKKHFVFERKRV